MSSEVYYLTGMGGRLDSGLGQVLLAKGFDISGRELVSEFRNLYRLSNSLRLSNFLLLN